MQATDKLTTKALLLYDQLPKTTAGIDPFLTDGQYRLKLVSFQTLAEHPLSPEKIPV